MERARKTGTPVTVLLVFLFIFLFTVPARAESTPRAAAHDTYGRMVFDWDGPVRWSADVLNSQLIVRFERPIVGDPKVLLRPLSKYVKGSSISPDRRVLTFPLAMPVQVKTFLSGTSVVVDLYPASEQTQSQAPTPKPAQATPPAPTPSQPAGEKPAEPPTEPKAAEADAKAIDLMVRGGEHVGYNRLVFDWPKPVGYAVDAAAGKAVISFDRPARVNVAALKAALPGDVAFVEARPAGKGTALELALPSELRIRHFASGPKVVVDIVRPAGVAPPPRAAGRPEPTLAPPPGAEVQPPAPAPLAPEPKPVTPAETLAQTAPANGKPAATPPPAPEEVKPKGKTVSLGVNFDQPVAAAVFRRAGWLWLVFDRRTEVDAKLLKRSGGEFVTHVEQIDAVKGGTAVRLLVKPGINPAMRKDGTLWVVDLADQPMAPKVPLEVVPQFDFGERGRLVITVSEATEKPVIFKDPEVGDTIMAIPVMPIGAGMRGDRAYPGVDIPATVQGVAVIPRTDGVRVSTAKAGIEISTPGGLWMSREAAEGQPTAGAQATASGPLDIVRWMRGGLDKFVPEHQKLMTRMASIRPTEANAQRLEIARHYLANGMGAEALGILRLIAQADPDAVETGPFRAVRGAANFLMHRDQEAIEDLSHNSITTDPEAGLWLAAAKARGLNEYARNALMLRLAPDDIKDYPARIRMALGREAVQSVIAAGDAKAGQKIVETMAGKGTSRADQGTIAYLKGLVAEALKQPEVAIAHYQEAESGESRPDRAYAARARIELELKTGKITAAEAIHRLERLRFAWRGEDFEYRLLKRLGELLIADGRYGDGLRAFRSLVANFGDNPDIADVNRQMSETFNALYLDGLADKLTPVAAIGLYDEFQELTPSGDKGDEMIRKLADRLAAVDLLERASELLHHQVNFRLQGVERAKIGARLALLNLADRKPGEAMENLNSSEGPDLPPALYDQRRYMRVRALADLGRAADALALIVNDQSDQAKRLRAEIYWDLKKWPEAALALEASIDEPDLKKPLDPMQARRVLDLATALTFAHDERGLLRLRHAWGPHMAATEFREAFDLLTSAPERGIIDYRRIGDKIKEVEDFQTFMNEWRKRVQTEGLSSIN